MHAPWKQEKMKSFFKSNLFFISIILITYSIFALFDLGDTKAPMTGYTLKKGESYTFDLGCEKSLNKISSYLGPTSNVDFCIEIYSSSSQSFETIDSAIFKNVFAWKDFDFPYHTQYIRFTCVCDKASIMELVFIDSEGKICTPKNITKFPNLFDETSLYPNRISFRNGTYFDEIYHARTAYEFLHGLKTYEISHPPLGKILISIGIFFFGMNPFGWRISGTLFGIFMVPFFFLFSKKILKDDSLTRLATLLFTFDFMHFTQTRIATIDVFVTFFILIMYYFMYCYLEKSRTNLPFKKTAFSLGSCGICMGLAIACKWTGIYAATGLAIFFFSSLFLDKKNRKYIIKAGLFCILFFIIIPICIYALSYIPFLPKSEQGYIATIIENQEFMLSYHSGLTSTHPYASNAYTWPFIVRPIWYYSGILNDSLREGISAFGNPLVWWPGIPSFLFLLIYGIKKKDRIANFLFIGYLSQYLPWFFITRPIFIYHYFPSTIFVALMNAYALKCLKPHINKKLFLIIISFYAFLTVLLFLLFYPVLSGQPIEAEFVDYYLRWFSSWVLTHS